MATVPPVTIDFRSPHWRVFKWAAVLCVAFRLHRLAAAVMLCSTRQMQYRVNGGKWRVIKRSHTAKAT